MILIRYDDFLLENELENKRARKLKLERALPMLTYVLLATLIYWADLYVYVVIKYPLTLHLPDP